MDIKNIVLFVNGVRGKCVLHQLLKEKRNVIAIVAPEKSVFWEEEKEYSNYQLIKTKQINEPDILEKFKYLNPDIFIVAGFPTIFKQDILNIPKLGVINLHGGMLPKYRGGSPLNWQIINDEKQIGVSIILMNDGIDTGDVLAEEFFNLEEHDDINSVHYKANICFSRLVSRVLQEFENNKLQPRKQDHNEAHYWVQRSNQDSYVDWKNVTAREAYNLIRALKAPYPSAFTYAENNKIFLYESCIPNEIIKGTPGKVVYLQGKGPYIICKDKAILITKVSEILKNGIRLND